MTPRNSELAELIAAEADATPSAAVAAIADAARSRHGDGISAVLFYGSVLRDNDIEGKIVDLYLLGDSYGTLHRSGLAGALNAALPPNVYYIEAPFQSGTVRAKYALMTLAQFERLVGPKAFHPYFWARFAQPAVLVWARDGSVRKRIGAALVKAVATLAAEIAPLFREPPSSQDFWVRAFSETYRTELRAEGSSRAAQLYSASAARYNAVFEALRRDLAEAWGAQDGRGAYLTALSRWWGRRVVGKALSVLRLLKAASTFSDGASYLAWKIQRHSGVPISLTPWQRRHPILAAGWLFWRLYFRGAFR